MVVVLLILLPQRTVGPIQSYFGHTAYSHMLGDAQLTIWSSIFMNL